jgi:pimeloyl-ACP methyl ester carboxylesterase
MKKSMLGFAALVFVCCSCGGVRVGAIQHQITAADGQTIVAYDLVRGKSQKVLAHPRAVFCYVQGSEYKSVIDHIGMVASAVIFGSRAILVEKKGCSMDTVDMETAIRFDDKQTRTSDYKTVLDTLLKDLPGDIPVILVGGSEGGDIAATVADNPHITHLIMICAGGGMSQAEEFRQFVQEKPGYLGCKDVAALDSILHEIETSSDSLKLWAGHPYKRWNSYLRDSSLSYLQNIKIPTLLVHGDADGNVPVESTRSLYAQLIAKGKTNFTYIEYPHLDHSLVDVRDGKSRYPYLEVDIIKWLKTNGLVSDFEAKAFIHRVKKNHRDIF